MVEYSLNHFLSHRHVFVKIVNKQISHALKSRPLPIWISSNFAIFLFNWPQKLSGETCLQKKVEELISVSFQVSECYCEFLYRQSVHRIFPRFSLDVVGNTPTSTYAQYKFYIYYYIIIIISARLLFLLWGSYFECIQSLKMHLISVESNKIW